MGLSERNNSKNLAGNHLTKQKSPMIIHSIPFLNEEFVRQEKKRTTLDWHEFRLDYHKKPTLFPLDLIDEKTIITIRDIASGGKYGFPQAKKIEFYQKICEQSGCLVDFEIENYQQTQIPSENLILSHHNFKTFDKSKVEAIIKKANSISAKYLKIAVPIDNYSQLNDISCLISKSNKAVLFVGMGKLGKIARFLANHLGSAGFYVGSAGFATASGQLTTNDVDKFNLRDIDSSTKIGGLIGGEQVYDSMGMKFYNQYFQKNTINAVYFPFPVTDLPDFKNWISSCSFRYKFYGFSVTMPFKKAFISAQSKLPTINIINFHNHFTGNTDIIAFKKSFAYLGIQKNDSALILGSGGSAEAVLYQFNKTHKISILARNEKRKMELEKYRFYPVNEKKYDVLVNCTPIQSAEIFQLLEKVQFNSVIDLPYQSQNTSLIDYCMKHKIPFVDGKMFWNWQAEKQLQWFMKMIVGKS
jgi:3-dehydroquinate dehydratase type I